MAADVGTGKLAAPPLTSTTTTATPPVPAAPAGNTHSRVAWPNATGYDQWLDPRYRVSRVMWGQDIKDDFEHVRYHRGVIAAASHNNAVELFAASSGQWIDSLRLHKAWVWDVALDDESLVSASCDHTLIVWDVKTKGESRYQTTLFGHQHWVQAVQFNETRIFSGSADRTVKVWDRTTGTCMSTLRGHTSFVYCISLFGSHDPFTLVSGSGEQDATIRVWDTRIGQCVSAMKGAESTVMSLSGNDSQLVLSGSHDASAMLWDLRLESKSVCELTGHAGAVGATSFGPGEILVTGSHDSTVKLWTKTGAVMSTLSGHSGVVAVAEFSPDVTADGVGCVLRTVSMDNTIRQWDFSASTTEAAKGIEADRLAGREIDPKYHLRQQAGGSGAGGGGAGDTAMDDGGMFDFSSEDGDYEDEKAMET